MNRKKGMVYYTLWIEKEEERSLIKILNKEIKTDRDLKLIGDILCRVNANGDLKHG